MSKVIELRKTLEAKNDTLKGILAAGNDLTAEETANASALMAEVKGLKSQLDFYIAANEATDEVKAYLNTPAALFSIGGTQPGSREEAVLGEPIKGFSKEQWAALATKAYGDAFQTYLAKGIHGLGNGDLKTLQEGLDSSGGFLVPDQIQNELIMKKPTPTNIAGKVRRYTTSRDSLTIPKMIWNTDDLYTSGVRMTKTGEIPASSTTAQMTDPIFGQVRIDIFTEMVSGQITRDMIEDSLFDLNGVIAQQFGMARDIKMDLKILMGTGSGEQSGIMASPGGTIGGQAQPAVVNIGSPLTSDGLIRLAYSLPVQYDDTAVFVFNKTNTQAGIALLKDSANRYMFAYGQNDDKLASARPTSLLGYDIVRSGLMPNAYAADISTANGNAFPIIFGDLTGYAVIERVGLSIQVLDQTKAKDNQIELVGRWRWGGQTVEEYKLKVGKVA